MAGVRDGDYPGSRRDRMWLIDRAENALAEVRSELAEPTKRARVAMLLASKRVTPTSRGRSAGPASAPGAHRGVGDAPGSCSVFTRPAGPNDAC
jgi:hypothetical protein